MNHLTNLAMTYLSYQVSLERKTMNDTILAKGLLKLLILLLTLK